MSALAMGSNGVSTISPPCVRYRMGRAGRWYTSLAGDHRDECRGQCGLVVSPQELDRVARVGVKLGCRATMPANAAACVAVDVREAAGHVFHEAGEAAPAQCRLGQRAAWREGGPIARPPALAGLSEGHELDCSLSGAGAPCGRCPPLGQSPTSWASSTPLSQRQRRVPVPASSTRKRASSSSTTITCSTTVPSAAA